MEKTKLFDSVATCEIEANANRWLQDAAVRVTDIIFTCISPGREAHDKEKRAAIFLYQETDSPAGAGIKIFDSGVDSPQVLAEQMEAWFKETGVQSILTKTFVTQPMDMFQKVRLFVLVLYRTTP